MYIRSLLLVLSTISFSLLIGSCSQVRANRLAYGQLKVEAKLTKSYAGTALGELKVDGKKISLAHAYAIATNPVRGDDKALKKSKTAYIVLITERAMPDDLLENFWQGKGVSTKSIVEDRVKGLLIALDAKGYNATFLYPPLSGWGLSSFREGIEPGKLQITTNQIAGEITGSAPLMQNFKYKFSFKAPIRQPSVSTKLFAGEAALKSQNNRSQL
jgi:hypothetical protein